MLLERKLYSAIKNYHESKEAVIITGMRRTGKTSVLQFVYDRIGSQNKLFLDLENPLNQRYFQEENYERVRAHLEFLGLDLKQRPYLFLDEIQLVKTLPSVLKYLIDHYSVKCFLSGSASFYLKNLFTESLAGRKYLFELFPLDFEEFLQFKGAAIRIPKETAQLDRAFYETVSPYYDEYLKFGGFPEVVLKANLAEKEKALEEIFTSYFQLEVLRLGDYRKNTVVRDLMLLLMNRVGSKVDVSKISSELGVSRITVNEYLSFLEGTYFIKLLRPYSRNRDSEVRKAAKVYLCDSGLLGRMARVDEGTLFENNVFQILRTRGEIHYYQRKSGGEIDFILNKEVGIEVKLRATPQDLRKLEKIAKQIGLREVKIVSKAYGKEIVGSGKLGFAFGL